MRWERHNRSRAGSEIGRMMVIDFLEETHHGVFLASVGVFGEGAMGVGSKGRGRSVLLEQKR